jgi:RNA polymerase sigma factor (sigma-70 family)
MVAFVLSFNPSPINKKFTLVNSIEERLINGIRDGNKASIDQLYKMYSSSLMGIISRIVKFDEIAEDILQETFIKIWKSIAHYDSSKGRLFTWMANLAKNTAIDQIRSKYYTHAIKTDAIENIQIDYLDVKNNHHLNLDAIGLKQLMCNLKPDQKKIIDLFYFEGYTQAEVAEELNMPLGTVKTRIRQAIIALRKYFNETAVPISIGA